MRFQSIFKWTSTFATKLIFLSVWACCSCGTVQHSVLHALVANRPKNKKRSSSSVYSRMYVAVVVVHM